MSVLIIRLQAVVQRQGRAGDAPAATAGGAEGPPHVFAPQSIDDGVNGGVEQREHGAEGEHRLDVVVHPPE